MIDHRYKHVSLDLNRFVTYTGGPNCCPYCLRPYEVKELKICPTELESVKEKLKSIEKILEKLSEDLKANEKQKPVSDIENEPVSENEKSNWMLYF